MKTYLYTLIGLLCGGIHSQAQTWHSLGTGLNGPVYEIVIHGEDVYVGGNFTDAGGHEDADYIARWDGSAWHAVAPGLNNTVYAIVVDGEDVYVGGEFTTPYNWVVRLVNGEWSPLSGLDAPVKVLAKGQYGLYAAGPFSSKFALWFEEEWTVWGAGFTGEINAIAIQENDVFIGGLFSSASFGNGVVKRIAHFKGFEWRNIEQPAEINIVYDLAIHGTDLYLGGEPLTLCEGGMGGIHEPILRWDGNEYTRLEQRLGGCRKVTTLGIMNHFLLVDATDILEEENVFKWNVDSQKWDGFVTGFNVGPDYIHAFASDGANLYMGGTFTDLEGEEYGDYIVRLENAVISATDGNNNNSIAPLQVFPNPAEDIIQFEWEDCLSGSHLITMTDITGAAVLKKQTVECMLDISSLGAGLYFLKVDNGVDTCIGKVVKQ